MNRIDLNILEKKAASLFFENKNKTYNIKQIKFFLNVEIDLMNLKVSDPFSEIKLVIKKNNSNIEKIENLKPLFIKDRTLIYDYENESNFWGGNQFRYFNSSSIKLA